MNTKAGVGIFLLVLVLIFGYFAVKQVQRRTTSAPPTQQHTIEKTSQTVTPVSNIQEITVKGNEFAFTPSTFTVKQGQPVRIVFENTGKFPHNLTISDLHVETRTIFPGQKDSVIFTPNRAGTFTYSCTVPGHADKGMTGTLTVQ